MPAPLIGIKVLTSANTIRMDSKQSHNATFPSDSFCQTTPLCLIVCAKKKMMHVFKHWKRNRLAGRLTYKEPCYAQRLLSDLAIIDTPPPPSLPVLLIFWLQIGGYRQYENPSVWLLTEKKQEMYSAPSVSWLLNNRAWLGNCIANRAGSYDVLRYKRPVKICQLDV